MARMTAISLALVGLFGISLGNGSVKFLAHSQSERVVGGACYTDQADGMCEGVEMGGCGDKSCECKYKTQDADGNWSGWSGWDSSHCDRYAMDTEMEEGYILDYEIDERCPNETNEYTDPDLEFTECGEEDDGTFNYYISQGGGRHYCYKVRPCAASCTALTDGTAKCNAGTTTGTNPPDDDPASILKSSCTNDPNKKKCPPESGM